MSEPKTPGDPDSFELRLLGIQGRLSRLIDETGCTPIEAVEKLLAPEDPAAYSERNRAAMAALEARMLSPEYLARFEEAMRDPDPESRARKLADIKRENFAFLDMEAVHRTISANNRRAVAEGMLPPDAKI